MKYKYLKDCTPTKKDSFKYNIVYHNKNKIIKKLVSIKILFNDFIRLLIFQYARDYYISSCELLNCLFIDLLVKSIIAHCQ